MIDYSFQLRLILYPLRCREIISLTETFQKISNMYGYLFVHITLHGFFSEFSVVRGGGNDETVSTGCGSPSVLRPGWHMQETALWIPRGAFCPLEGGPRHIGTDTLAPVLHLYAFISSVRDKIKCFEFSFLGELSIYIYIYIYIYCI